MLIENWNSFMRRHGGEKGARDVFEKLMDQLLRAENPGKEIHIIKAAGGDGGIDVYVRQKEGIDVYQCKFFMDAMNASRWHQVKESFERATQYAKSEEGGGVKILRWFLCVPREMRKEDIAQWEKFCQARESYGIHLSCIDGNEIIQRMQKCDREKGTHFIDDYFDVSEGAKRALRQIPQCLTLIPPVNRKVGLVGREEILETVISMLENEGKTALVSGLGGIGKTAVMQWVCNVMKEKGCCVAWIDCGQSLKEDLLLLADGLGISVKNPQTAYKEITRALKNRTHGSFYLFLDNLTEKLTAEMLGDLNSLNAHIMVTSRIGYDAFPAVNLAELEESRAVTMFFRYYNGDSDRSFRQAAASIVTSVKRHTLLVELLAKAARKTGGTLADFDKKLKAEGVYRVFDRELETAHDGNASIENCVRKLYEFSNLTEAQQHILKLFSIFTPEQEIYWKICDWAGLDKAAMDELVELAWLERAGTENNFRIHQIIRDSLKMQMKERKEELKLEEYGELLDKITDIYSYVPRNLEYTKVRERLIVAEDVAQNLVGRTDLLLERWEKADEIEDLFLTASHIFNNLANINYHQGDYEKAFRYYEKALVIRERVLGADHPDIAAIYNNMAVVYSEQGDFKKALRYFEKALTIRERVLGADHPDTAMTYNNMAVVYRKQGDYEKALRYYEKALAIIERVLGADHPDIAATYNNMAAVYDEQGDYEKALRYYGKALAIKERVLGADHPDTASTYNNMAAVYDDQGDYEKALRYYKKALAIRERVLGADHPDTAMTYGNMANVYAEQGEFEKALRYYEKALSIYERVLGADHPDTAMTYNNMALVYHDQGDYEKALRYYEKALAIQERVLGADHPDTAATYNNMAGVYQKQGDYEKALRYYGKALAIYDRVLGADQPATASTYNNMAAVYDDQGDYEKALRYYKKALAIKERVLGADHPDTATTYYNMGLLYQNQGDHGTAIRCFEKALRVFKAKLGDNHPYTQYAQSALSELVKLQKRSH